MDQDVSDFAGTAWSVHGDRQGKARKRRLCVGASTGTSHHHGKSFTLRAAPRDTASFQKARDRHARCISLACSSAADAASPRGFQRSPEQEAPAGRPSQFSSLRLSFHGRIHPDRADNVFATNAQSITAKDFVRPTELRVSFGIILTFIPCRVSKARPLGCNCLQMPMNYLVLRCCISSNSAISSSN